MPSKSRRTIWTFQIVRKSGTTSCRPSSKKKTGCAVQTADPPFSPKISILWEYSCLVDIYHGESGGSNTRLDLASVLYNHKPKYVVDDSPLLLALLHASKPFVPFRKLVKTERFHFFQPVAGRPGFVIYIKNI
ncbi:hypothetical protein CPB84DRAFT_821313 [Gymnopilus junonius]|uniref:Uncharacterized protein n=1 Tax=Gymnopilus junonius TaxID=109634 RepID=A0A9P5TNK3_GYMJU|nr:hypothetical protein CPB84DRAFT_821313 [Gymnopilus junonius]